MFLRGMWKKLSSNLSLTWVCRSGKQSRMFRSTSAFSCEQIEPPVQESFEVPNLLWSHSDVSLSRTFAILQLTESSWRNCHSYMLTSVKISCHLPDVGGVAWYRARHVIWILVTDFRKVWCFFSRKKFGKSEKTTVLAVCCWNNSVDTQMKVDKQMSFPVWLALSADQITKSAKVLWTISLPHF